MGLASFPMNQFSDFPQQERVKVLSRWKIGIVRSVWHGDLTQLMRDDAKSTLVKAGVSQKNVVLLDAPGAFEIPLLAEKLIKKKKLSGLIALGVIVRGQTHHARLIADACAKGIMDVQLRTGVPIIFEVLYVDRIEDARARAIGKGAKGPLAAATVLNALAKLAEMR